MPSLKLATIARLLRTSLALHSHNPQTAALVTRLYRGALPWPGSEKSHPPPWPLPAVEHRRLMVASTLDAKMPGSYSAMASRRLKPTTFSCSTIMSHLDIALYLSS